MKYGISLLEGSGSKLGKSINSQTLTSLTTTPAAIDFGQQGELVYFGDGSSIDGIDQGFLVSSYVVPGPPLPTSIVATLSFAHAHHDVEFDSFDIPITFPDDWDTPATVGTLQRGTRNRRSQEWILSDIDGPWEETGIVIYDGTLFDGNGSHQLTVTLDRFGWLPVDEITVGRDRRQALRRVRTMAAGLGAATPQVAAVPEPSAVVLLLVAVAVMWRRR